MAEMYEAGNYSVNTDNNTTPTMAQQYESGGFDTNTNTEPTGFGALKAYATDSDYRDKVHEGATIAFENAVDKPGKTMQDIHQGVRAGLLDTADILLPDNYGGNAVQEKRAEALASMDPNSVGGALAEELAFGAGIGTGVKYVAKGGKAATNKLLGKGEPDIDVVDLFTQLPSNTANFNDFNKLSSVTKAKHTKDINIDPKVLDKHFDTPSNRSTGIGDLMSDAGDVIPSVGKFIKKRSKASRSKGDIVTEIAELEAAKTGIEDTAKLYKKTEHPLAGNAVAPLTERIPVINKLIKENKSLLGKNSKTNKLVNTAINTAAGGLAGGPGGAVAGAVLPTIISKADKILKTVSRNKEVKDLANKFGIPKKQVKKYLKKPLTTKANKIFNNVDEFIRFPGM